MSKKFFWLVFFPITINLLMVFCLPIIFSSASIIKNQKSCSNFICNDEISAFEIKLAPLKKQIPPNHTIGYLTDSKENEKVNLKIVSYSFIPRAVNKAKDQDYIICQFIKKYDFYSIDASKYDVVWGAQNIFLLKRKKGVS